MAFYGQGTPLLYPHYEKEQVFLHVANHLQKYRTGELGLRKEIDKAGIVNFLVKQTEEYFSK